MTEFLFLVELFKLFISLWEFNWLWSIMCKSLHYTWPFACKIFFAGSFQNNLEKPWMKAVLTRTIRALWWCNFFPSVLSPTSDNTVSADISPEFVFTVWEYYVVWSTWVNGYSSVHVDWVELVFVKLRGVHPHLAGSYCTPPPSLYKCLWTSVFPDPTLFFASHCFFFLVSPMLALLFLWVYLCKYPQTGLQLSSISQDDPWSMADSV